VVSNIPDFSHILFPEKQQPAKLSQKFSLPNKPGATEKRSHKFHHTCFSTFLLPAYKHRQIGDFVLAQEQQILFFLGV